MKGIHDHKSHNPFIVKRWQNLRKIESVECAMLIIMDPESVRRSVGGTARRQQRGSQANNKRARKWRRRNQARRGPWKQ